jgi:hypothetical protein
LADTPSVVVELIAQSDVENFGDDRMRSEVSGNSRVIKFQAGTDSESPSGFPKFCSPANMHSIEPFDAAAHSWWKL